MKKDKNDSFISESELRTILDNLSRKYSIKVIVENNEEKMLGHIIGYNISKNAVIANIPMFLDMIKEQRKFLKFHQIENLIEAKFLHEYHHSKINRKSTDEMPLINFCEDYYIENILMKNNESLIMENSYLREIYSERIEDDKLNIIIQDLNVIYVLCTIYDKEELKNIYGDDIVDYKKIFDTINSENDIWEASSELLKLYLQRKTA